MRTEEELFAFMPPLPALFGHTALEVFPVTNLCMITWALLCFAPRWKHTPTLSLLAPLILAAVYTAILLSDLLVDNPGAPPTDFTSLKGVMLLMSEPNGALACWVHYCVHDPLVGRWILMDSVHRRSSLMVHIIVMVPVLALTLMLSPAGWLLYMALVRPFLPGPMDGDAKKNN